MVGVENVGVGVCRWWWGLLVRLAVEKTCGNKERIAREKRSRELDGRRRPPLFGRPLPGSLACRSVDRIDVPIQVAVCGRSDTSSSTNATPNFICSPGV